MDRIETRESRLRMACMALAVTLVLAGAQVAFAATYYIDYDAGDDGSNGTSSPWKHVPGDEAYGGQGSIQSGDTVVFKKGVTYRGKIKTLAPSVTYTVGNWGTGDAVIDGSGQDACIEVNHSNISITGGSGRNLTLTGNVRHAALWNYAGSDLSGSSFTDLKLLYVGSESSVEGIGIKIGGTDNAYTRYTVANCEFFRCYSAGLKLSGNGTSEIDIHHNTFQENGTLPAERCQVNLSSNAGAGVQNVRFHDNVVKNAGPRANGINCNNAGNDIFNNVITGNPGDGISLAPNYNRNYPGVLKAYGNTISNNGGYGVVIGASDGGRHVLLYNNVIHRNGVIEINLCDSATYNEITNNTIYHPGEGHGIRVQAGCADNTIRNNIVSVNNGSALFDSTGRTAEDYNLFYRSSGGSRVVWNNGGQDNLAAYRSASNQGTYSAWADPAFSDTQKLNLPAGSPGIDAGADLSQSFTDDMNGTQRPRGSRWDMGAYEN